MFCMANGSKLNLKTLIGSEKSLKNLIFLIYSLIIFFNQFFQKNIKSKNQSNQSKKRLANSNKNFRKKRRKDLIKNGSRDITSSFQIIKP